MSEIYEGNSITVNNINKSKAKIKIRGGSWQETRSGKNKFYGKFTTQVKEGISLIVNSDDTILINGTNNLGNLVYNSSTFSLKAGTYIASGMPDGTSLYDVYIQFAYFENEEKKYVTANGTKFTLLEDKDNVVCYIGLKKGKTANNIILKPMLREATIEDDTYEQYGVSPSPDFPSEIKNVGDNINLYNKNDTTLILDAPISNNAVGTRASGTYKTVYIPCEPNTSYVVTKKYDETKNRLIVACSTEIPNYSQSVEVLGKDENATELTVLTSNTAKYLLAYVWVIGGSTTAQEMLDSIKIEEGTKATFYSNYNCGSLGVTVSNNNIFNGFFTTNGIWNNDGTINYTIQSKLYWRTDFIKIPNKNIYFSSKQLNRFSSATLLEFDTDKKYITSNKIYQVNSNLNNVSLNENTRFIAIQWNLQNAAEIEGLFTNFQIEVGSTASPYISHQEQTIIFPLAEGQKLRSLPNGVKDYLAEDGIHKNVGIIILNGSGGINENYFKATNNKFALGVNTEKGLLLKNLKTDNLKISVLSDKFLGVSWDIMNDTIEGWQIALRQDGSYTYLRLLTTGIEDAKALETFLQNNNAIVEYPLATEEIIPYTQEQQNAFYQLQNIVLYDGINHISTDNELGSMSVEVSKIIEDYETYISSNGFFINSQNDIHYLIDFSESELPCMAEATETTVKAAGRNGDIVLSTTYDPNNFNIVCYTEDNLTQEEKVKEEMKLKKLLNSIKNKTIPLAFEKDDKFYKVKYSGAFSSTNFPKHLKFSIPLKTSEAYGKDLIKKVIFGNGEETSDTFEDVGAIFTIKGPANSPIISLNDYSIEYDNPLLEGDKLIINSSNSTITHINSDGVKTNAMRYYNHQFPKIENGKNVLKVLSGVNEANVSVEWYDYKF